MDRLIHVFWRSAACLAVVATLTTAARAGEKARLPSLDRIEETVERFFEGQRGYGPGEIISQSQVRDLFIELRRVGWIVPGQDDILGLVPDDSELLVRELRTPDGRKFSRQISRYPGAYDRLDRLVHMPTGKSILQRLVKGPDGYKLLQYMTTAPGGDQLGRMLSGTPTGRDFNQPTGRIYTAASLIEALRTKYAESWQAIRRENRTGLGLQPNGP
jgi:hypothetical protein